MPVLLWCRAVHSRSEAADRSDVQPGLTFATIIGLLDPDFRNPPAHRRQSDSQAMLQHAINDVDDVDGT